MTECFYSGSNPSPLLEEVLLETPKRLFSCHGSYIGVLKQWFKRAPALRVWRDREVMLDSGAFTAWNKGERVTVDDVIRKYDEALGYMSGEVGRVWMINLDVIPGQRGRTATWDEIQEAVAGSDRNYDILRKRYGDAVIPVFHQDESVERLEEVIRLHPSYICVSPRNDLMDTQRREWSARCHARIAGRRRTHGLAATGARMMLEVPWSTVDSATWIQVASYGGIMMSVRGRFKSFQISSKSGQLANLDAHYDNLNDIDRKSMADYIAEAGFDLDTLRESHPQRCLFNLRAIEKLLADNERTPTPAQNTLFGL